MKYWTYAQNNSGGYYHETEDLGAYIIVEANDCKEADKIADKLTEESSRDYCECCGLRWWIDSTEEDGKIEPTIYGKNVMEYKSCFEGDYCVIHKLDGTKEKINLS